MGLRYLIQSGDLLTWPKAETKPYVAATQPSPQSRVQWVRAAPELKIRQPSSIAARAPVALKTMFVEHSGNSQGDHYH